LLSLLDGKDIKDGDKIIVSGTIGDHGMCIMSKRDYLDFDCEIESDCNILNKLTQDILDKSKKIKIMRDPTRGGLATTLKEIVDSSDKSMILYEKDIPIKEEVISFCELLGFDPLYIANEGKLICIVDKDDAMGVLEVMKKNSLGKDAMIIGEVIDDNKKNLYLRTNLGSTKILFMSKGDLLPRIC